MKTITYEQSRAQGLEGVYQERGWYIPQCLIAFLEKGIIDPLDLVLLGRINALCDPERGCWASNKYFYRWLKISERNLSRRLALLQRVGIIRIETVRRGPMQGSERRIFVDLQGDHLIRNLRAHRALGLTGPAGPVITGQKWPVKTSMYLLRKSIHVGAAIAATNGERFFDFDGQSTSTKIPHRKSAIKIAKEFYRQIVKFRLHLNRADLPKSNPEKKRRTLQSWVRSASVLIDQVEDIQYILRVMSWYFLHRRHTYLSDIRSMTTFTEKFFKVEKVMLKEEGRQETGPQIIIEKM